MSEADCTQELAQRARAGDREAFEGLIRPLRSRLEDQVRARMGERVKASVEAEEVVQETLLKAYESIERLEWQGEEAFYRWLGVIAEHVIWHHAEGASRFHLELDRDHAADGSSVDRTILREERQTRLERALKDLSPEYREVIVLTRIDGLKIAAVASRMGRSPNAVKKLLARALKELKHHFGDTTGSLRLPDRPLEIGGANHAD